MEAKHKSEKMTAQTDNAEAKLRLIKR